MDDQFSSSSTDPIEAEAHARFLANFAHEVRTSLSLIQEPVKAILDGRHGSISPEMRAQHQTVLRNAGRLLRLANQVTDLSKLGRGQITLKARRQDLVHFVQVTMRTFSSLAKRAGIKFTCEVPSEAAVPLFFDRTHLEKVLANLFSNALKFTPEGGHVCVTITHDEADAQIRVEDTGSGIPKEERTRIFERYYQAGAVPPQTQSGGTGIGLALTRELVELHGGAITVESTLGEGSTFVVSLPTGRRHLTDEQIAPDAPTPDATSSEPDQRITPEDVDQGDVAFVDKPTVLVVDDHATLRALVRHAFTPSYRVLEATDGLDGLERARNDLPDCIVADVAMPRLDGFQMGQSLKEDPSTAGIPLLFLSARAELKDELEGLLTGADDYMTKPFDSEILWARVGNLIAQRYRLRQRLQERSFPDDEDEEDAHPAWIQPLRSIVFDHLADEQFGPQVLADASTFSYSSMYRKLRAERDLTPSQFIRALRLERAAHLLEQQAGSVSEVAYAVGFKSLSHFSRCFKNRYGQSPSAYV